MMGLVDLSVQAQPQQGCSQAPSSGDHLAHSRRVPALRGGGGEGLWGGDKGGDS